jgi:ABC-type nitrate/sulfonate/bicarbonate transport system substrate-binding protein
MNCHTITRLCSAVVIALYLAPPGSRASAAEKLKAESVVFAITSHNANFLPLVVAEQKGFYRGAGIRANIQPMKLSVAVAGAATGEVPYIFTTTSTVGAAMQGLPLRIVAFINVGSWFLYADPNIRSISELKGKIIAQASPHGLQNAMLKGMLKANGVDPGRDVRFLYIASTDLTLAVLKSGQVHAAISQLPLPLIAEREGFRILGNTADYQRFPTAAIGTSLERIKNNRDEVKAIIRGTLRATKFIQENIAESSGILSRWAGISEDQARRTLELMKSTFLTDGMLKEEETQAFVDERMAALKVTRKVSPSELFDFSLLNAVLKESP